MGEKGEILDKSQSRGQNEKKTLSNKNGNFWKNKKSQKKLFDKIKTFLYLHP